MIENFIRPAPDCFRCPLPWPFLQPTSRALCLAGRRAQGGQGWGVFPGEGSPVWGTLRAGLTPGRTGGDLARFWEFPHRASTLMGNSQKAQFLRFREGAVRHPLPQSRPGQNRSKYSWAHLGRVSACSEGYLGAWRPASGQPLWSPRRSLPGLHLSFILQFSVLSSRRLAPHRMTQCWGPVLASFLVVRPPVGAGAA